MGSERTIFTMAPEMLSTLVRFDIENETRAVKSFLSPAIAAFLDKPTPPKLLSVLHNACLGK